MDFELTDDQRMLADTVAGFAKKRSPVSRFRKLRDDPVGFDPAVWREMGDLGWLAAPFPEEAGGLGGGFVEIALILEKLGATLVPEPYLSSVVLGGTALLHGASDEQRARFLAPMMEGRAVLALAHTERESRFGARPVETRAVRDAGAYRLSGQKVFVVDGHRADHWIVSALVDGSVALFVVDRDAAGASVRSLPTIDGRRAAQIAFDGATVGDDRLLCTGEKAASVLDRALDAGAAATCAEAVGVLSALLEMTVGYLRTREQFGVKIGSFQALSHRAVDMFVEVEMCRSMALMASLEMDNPDGDTRRRAVSAAKVQLATGGKWVAQQALQLHGGIGITDEHDSGLYFKRMLALQTLCGDEEHHLARFAALPTFTAGVI